MFPAIQYHFFTTRKHLYYKEKEKYEILGCLVYFAAICALVAAFVVMAISGTLILFPVLLIALHPRQTVRLIKAIRPFKWIKVYLNAWMDR